MQYIELQKPPGRGAVRYFISMIFFVIDLKRKY